MGLGTPLRETHIELGAALVDFGGWDMPLHYGSQLTEHHAVRRDAGMFDVSHMGIIDAAGHRVREFLQRVLANDVAKLTVPGKALYSCMLLPTGGVIDDLIVYFMSDTWFRLVVNAGTYGKDFTWLAERAEGFDVSLRKRADLAMIAVQGPNARAQTASLLPPAQGAAALAIAPFAGAQIDSWFVARTGYTGEDGFEVMLPADEVVALWGALHSAGVQPAGLGARDTLRLEAGMNLYGSDMDDTRHPLESGLEWTVAFEPAEREFIGREALERVRGTRGNRLVGLVLEDRGVLRSHQKIFLQDAPPARDAAPAPGAAAAGEVTSGTFSPTLNRSIALARVAGDAGEHVRVDIRGKLHTARIVKPPFVRHGRILVQV
jgi:aminomethyltransferase